ncbi:hypothetical protein AALB39_08225 [Lachnospiraceae bacterium 54-53]
MKLENVKFDMDTKLVLNIGDPMGKTNAPRAYNKLFSELDMNAIMLPVEIPKGRLPEFLEACKLLKIRYLCPTMPHKRDIIPLLDDVDESSRVFQSVNAIRIDEDGTSHGVGLDGKGALNAILASGIDLNGKEAVMLGSGSISGVIGLELSKRGIKKLTILNRTADQAEAVAGILNRHTSMETAGLASTPENLDEAAEHAQLFLQVTPLGMAGYGSTHEYLGFMDKLPRECLVFDVIVNPADTPVIAAARARGLKTVPGLKMLAGQMEEIFRFMFEVELTPENKEACIQELCCFLGISAEIR